MKDLERLNAMEAQLYAYTGATDPEGCAKLQEATEYLAQHATPEVKQRITQFVRDGYDRIAAEVKELTMRERLGDTYEMIPFSYIAREYFGKSPAWLLQRINGYKVNGKPCAFNDEERKRFNYALQDLSKRIGSLCFG